MESNIDENKYFIALDKEATQLKTKPLTKSDLDILKKRLTKLKEMIKELINEFYDQSCSSYQIQSNQLNLMEQDINNLSTKISSVKSLIETDPFILSASQVTTLHDCVNFIRTCLSTLQSLAF